jgi:hypothetical protein
VEIKKIRASFPPPSLLNRILRRHVQHQATPPSGTTKPETSQLTATFLLRYAMICSSAVQFNIVDEAKL